MGRGARGGESETRVSWILKTHETWSQGSYDGSYFTGPGFSGQQRRAVRFGKRIWAEKMAHVLRHYKVRVIRVRRSVVRAT